MERGAGLINGQEKPSAEAGSAQGDVQECAYPIKGGHCFPNTNSFDRYMPSSYGAHDGL